MERNIYYVEHEFPLIGKQILCSCLVYQKMLKNPSVHVSICEILAQEENLGIVRETTKCRCLNCIRFMRVHAILHNACVRIYNKCGLTAVTALRLMFHLDKYMQVQFMGMMALNSGGSCITTLHERHTTGTVIRIW